MEKMRHHHQFLMKNKETMSQTRSNDVADDPFWLRQQVESWSGKHIARWIEGLGDCMNPFIGMIRDNIRSGKHLTLIDNQTLRNIGIIGLGPRKLIIQAIELLMYFCNDAPRENLQTLAMKVALDCNSVRQTMIQAIFRREKASRRSEIVSVLNNITNEISNLAEDVKRLIFWLDRSPFDENEIYVEWRNKISVFILSLVRNANVPPRSLFNKSDDIIQAADDLCDLCLTIFRGNDDPAILYTAHIEPALIKRAQSEVNWGINLQSSFKGVHVISEIKEGSPADLCGKIDAGDEILLINGKMVIGWDLVRVAERLGSSTDLELRLVVNKRPRDTVPISLRNAPKITTKPLVKMAPGSQATYTGEHEKCVLQGFNYPLNRRRSSTFVSTLQQIAIYKPMESDNTETRKKKRLRRASISCGRERENPDDDQTHRLDWNLMELLGRPEPKESHVVRRARTMRHQPDGYVRSFIDNKLVHEIEDDVVTEQLPFNVICPTEFAAITVVDNAELACLNIVEPQLTDPEWSAPPNDITQRFRAPLGDSNLSGLRVRASMKLPSANDDTFPFNVQPSPSASSMNSTCSPAPHKLLVSPFTDQSVGSGEDIPATPTTPSLCSSDKLFEGWVRRRKIGRELSENTNKWPKCWMCLKGPYLSIYPNQYAKIPDITINVSKCTVSDVVDIKTSKKNVFRLSRPNVDYYFSSYNPLDMKSWLSKISHAIEIYGTAPRGMSKSMTYYKEQESGDESQQPFHYNTMTGIPSLMSQNMQDGTVSGMNTLPRSAGAFLAGLTSKSKPASPTTSKPKK